MSKRYINERITKKLCMSKGSGENLAALGTAALGDWLFFSLILRGCRFLRHFSRTSQGGCAHIFTGARNKRGQIKMFETIGVLVVFFFLIVIGLSFYFVIAKKSTVLEYEKQTQLKGIALVRKAVTLPELDCARIGVYVENCIDILKLKHFNEIVQNDPLIFSRYSQIFGASTITVTRQFPPSQDPESPSEFPLFDNPLDDAGYDSSFVPVLLFDPINDRFDFGIVDIKHYEKELKV